MHKSCHRDNLPVPLTIHIGALKDLPAWQCPYKVANVPESPSSIAACCQSTKRHPSCSCTINIFCQCEMIDAEAGMKGVHVKSCFKKGS